MKTILLSINPQHVDNIFNGDKIYEYRKVACRCNVSKIIIYATSPVMKIVGEADVEDIIIDKPSKVWNKTKSKSGITKKFFDKYYENKCKAVAYKLKNIKQYETSQILSDFGIKFAPQSFVYVS